MRVRQELSPFNRPGDRQDNWDQKNTPTVKTDSNRHRQAQQQKFHYVLLYANSATRSRKFHNFICLVVSLLAEQNRLGEKHSIAS